MRSRKILNIVVVLLTVFFIVSFILSQVIVDDIFKNLFWVATPLLFCSILLDLNAWSKLGLDVDKTKTSTIKRGFNDSTTLLVVFYGTLLILIILFDSFSNEIMKNNFVIIGTFIMTLEFELFTYLSIWNAKKETRQLLKGSK